MPPDEAIKESNDKTVARCWEGIIPFRYACLIGISAAKIMPHKNIKRSANQKLLTRDTKIKIRPVRKTPDNNAVVRRLNNILIRGAAIPPAIFETATIAATK